MDGKSVSDERVHISSPHLAQRLFRCTSPSSSFRKYCMDRSRSTQYRTSFSSRLRFNLFLLRPHPQTPITTFTDICYHITYMLSPQMSKPLPLTRCFVSKFSAIANSRYRIPSEAIITGVPFESNPSSPTLHLQIYFQCTSHTSHMTLILVHIHFSSLQLTSPIFLPFFTSLNPT
jgi:hypothetical protein